MEIVRLYQDMETMNELVGVRADFVSGKVRPVQFVWRGRQYKVVKVPLVYPRTDGGRKYLCFSVDVGGMLVELAWDLTALSWRIIKCLPSYT